MHQQTPQRTLIGRLMVLGSMLIAVSSHPVEAWAQAEFEGPPVNYLTGIPNDAITRLQNQIDGGHLRLKFDPAHGYLKSLLKHLNIPVTSQLLVFSKTSLQVHHIGPHTPRAIYFNDDVYIGWVQNGDVIEVSTVDPRLGANFYTLQQKQQPRPHLVRQTHRCLSCHGASQTRNVPGHIVRSVFPSSSGLPVFSAGTFRTDDRSPFSQRWGGWYVTGTHGQQLHMGNVVVKLMRDPFGRERNESVTLDTQAGANIVDLKSRLDTAPYLTRHSDMVALMVLGHQTRTHNAVTRAGFAARRALRDADIFNKFTNQPPGTLSDSARRRIAAAGDRLLASLLFSGEQRLTSPVQGTTEFARHFARRGPRDRRGRSLRELDLRQRLFRHPCSFVIYGPAFDALPQQLQEYVFQRLYDILQGRDPSHEYVHLSATQRTTLLQILRDTKPTFDTFCQHKD
ncbi:MAG: hypothetical protein ABGZ17_00185 [Planctomycetaceae bacterium]